MAGNVHVHGNVAGSMVRPMAAFVVVVALGSRLVTDEVTEAAVLYAEVHGMQALQHKLNAIAKRNVASAANVLSMLSL